MLWRLSAFPLLGVTYIYMPRVRPPDHDCLPLLLAGPAALLLRVRQSCRQSCDYNACTCSSSLACYALLQHGYCRPAGRAVRSAAVYTV